MALQDITNAINSEIRNQNNLIEQEELADVLQVLADDNYKDTESIVGNQNGVNHDLLIVKNGKIVTINGTLENTTNNFRFISLALGLQSKYIPIKLTTNDNFVTVDPNIGIIAGTISPNETRYFTLTYISNNE